MARELQETIGEMIRLKHDIVDAVQAELRGNAQNPYDRIEKISAEWPNGYRRGYSLGSVGVNSYMNVLNERGIPTTVQASGTRVHYLRFSKAELPDIAIYPYGIVAVLADKTPVFDDPETSSRRSVVLQYNSSEDHTLLRPVEPLFNVDSFGLVLAPIMDPPTVQEYALLDAILSHFEAPPADE